MARLNVSDEFSPVAAAEARALQRGEQRLVRWIEDGVLVEVRALQDGWQITREDVEGAERRGELFSLWIRNQSWYPSAFLDFTPSELARITRALGDADPADKLLFLLHKHGGLGGKRPADAMADRRIDDVLRLASAWG